jgi:hypothetical protein
MARELGEAALLERDRVVIVDAIEADDRLAARKQALRDMEPDEAGGTRDKITHIRISAAASLLRRPPPALPAPKSFDWVLCNAFAVRFEGSSGV